MCGIAGASLAPTDSIDSRRLAVSLLLGIEDRGRHATGVAWNNDDEIWVCKDAIPASEFVTGVHVPSESRTFIAHTRWATQGSPTNNDNNHPIDVRGIVGVHNGCMWSDDLLFDLIGPEKRIAQVDSEAIFAFLLHSKLPTREALEMLTSGSAAIAWFNLNDTDTLNLARVSSSPLILARTSNGSLLFASTREALQRAADKNGLTISMFTTVEEGTFLQVREGEIVTLEHFGTAGDRELTEMERHALNLI